MRDESYLAAKVEAVNKANAYANNLYKTLVEILQPYLEKKVVKIDGTLVASLADDIRALNLPNDSQMQVLCSHYRTYSLSWDVRMSYRTGDWGCDYYTASVYVGKISDRILVEVCDKAPTHRTDITVTEIQEKRKKYEELKAIADKAGDEIPYQFRN